MATDQTSAACRNLQDISVNRKQYARILKRREQRKLWNDTHVIISGKCESRRNLAMARPRSSECGRFIKRSDTSRSLASEDEPTPQSDSSAEHGADMTSTTTARHLKHIH
uniref:Nuclear transcription factor Y subunit n=1 Tax=Spongospora subterranea TaxID=70186 RepID=A0A0H5R3J0_9EUKA|eukprot:CRZ02574.1 hypothetical protein [Spongospora subterranea]